MVVLIALAPAMLLVVQSRIKVPVYQSTATMWVLDPDQIQRPSLDVQNVYLTPAQRQASVLRDLLLTDGFRFEIASRANLIGPASTPAAAAAALSEAQRRKVSTAIGKAMSVTTNGANLLMITATFRDAATTQALANALIASYDQRLRNESLRQDAINLDYFDKQISVASAELAARRAAVKDYVRAHPNVNFFETGDLEYRSLVGRAEAQDASVNGLNKAIQDTHLSAVASSQALAARFNVLDDPSLPAQPIAQSRLQQFGLPAAALAAGMILAAAYLLVLYRIDHSIGSTEDLRGLNVGFLGYGPTFHEPATRDWWRRVPTGENARTTAASLALRKAM